MGSDPRDAAPPFANEQPQQRLWLPEFHLSRTPITNAQYQHFVAATHYPAPGHWPAGQPLADTEQFPVTYVSWADAQAFCTWAGVRLPTEAEWEKAARGGAMGLRYPWGNTVTSSQANYSGSGDPYESNNPPTTAVGYYNGTQTPTGVDMANGYGLYDMAGNLWEKCWDWYGASYYGDTSANADPHGPGTGVYRVMRGGGAGGAANYLRCAIRGVAGWIPDTTNSAGGFRCVRKAL